MTVSAEAVVSPLEQAVITPKITSTIKKFYVQRGSQVKEGQLLAELENGDLAGSAEQSKGEFEQAEAGFATTTGASLPEQIQKAELDAAAFKVRLRSATKVYDARKELFEQGAIPRRDLDSAEVALAQARSQNEQAQKQLSDLQRIGKEQTLKSAGGQLSAAKGKYLSAKAKLSYSEIRSPINGVVTDRPAFQGELATGKSADFDGDEYIETDCQGTYRAERSGAAQRREPGGNSAGGNRRADCGTCNADQSCA